MWSVDLYVVTQDLHPSIENVVSTLKTDASLESDNRLSNSDEMIISTGQRRKTQISQVHILIVNCPYPFVPVGVTSACISSECYHTFSVCQYVQ